MFYYKILMHVFLSTFFILVLITLFGLSPPNLSPFTTEESWFFSHIYVHHMRYTCNNCLSPVCFLLFGFTDILIRKILFHVDLNRFLVHTRQWSTSRLEIYHLYLLPHMGFNSDVILMGLNLWVCFFLLSVLIFPDCVVFTS